jgi:long-chain acyl-CoA synthetase
LSTILHRLQSWASEEPNSISMRYKKNGHWTDVTAKEYRDHVFYLALYLESIGFTSSDTSAILSYNKPEWVEMDLAPLLIGGKSAGLYPNASFKDVDYILNLTEAKVLAVQNEEYFNKLKDENQKLSIPASLEKIIVFEGSSDFSPLAISIKDALAEGKKISANKDITDYLSKLNPKDGAFMIFTSGTTGNPKGAILSHDNLVFTTDLSIKFWELPFKQGKCFSFLPLCHIAEKMQNVGVGVCNRYTISYCSGFDSIAAELPDVRPTVLLCVPRLWEKMMEGVNSKISQATGVKKVLADWAFAVGSRVAQAKYAKKTPNPLDLVQLHFANKLVLGKIKEKLGLDLVEMAASGAAALNPEVAKFFRILGIEIREVFGQTESTGVICMTQVGEDSLGTVGKAVPGLDFKIADDGEILSRGRSVFVGYLKNDEATKEAVDSEGWLHTGDLGVVNDRGLVVIRGRKKEIMKSSGGKMVAPLPIEENLKISSIISQVCMVGDGKKYFSALITLNEDLVNKIESEKLEIKESVLQDKNILNQVSECIDQVNKSLANYEQIKYFRVLPKEFSVENGEMTPTLKMKRAIIEKNFENVINSMY